MRKGEKFDQEISCDSKFILGMMDKLGNSTRSTYCSIGVANEEIIYLVIDNAAGYGTNEAVFSPYMTWSCKCKRERVKSLIRTFHVIPSSYLE